MKRTMKRIALALLLLWSFVGAPPPALAQSPELKAAYRQSKALNAQGKYAEAIPVWRRVLDLEEQEFGPVHSRVATALVYLGAAYHRQGRYSEAESVYKRALVIWEKTFGPDSRFVATILNSLNVLYRLQGR